MSTIKDILEKHRPSLAPYEDLYKHFHSHPELSFQEKNTAATIRKVLAKFTEFQVHSDIGKTTGLSAIFTNGEGPTILLRADMDALPIEEKTNLSYASKKRTKDETDGKEKPVMHACG
jgi:metal-dependent amidase/aminoacylase/carboxypeptidase family protein